MQIFDHEHGPLVPTHFLTVYSRNSNTGYSEEKYLEIGSIVKTDKGYQIGASRPADMDFLNDLAGSIKVQNFKALKFKGIIPEKVLYCHSEDAEPTLVWKLPSPYKMLYFSKAMGIESQMYQLPSMLFVMEKGELSVYRIPNDGRTDENTLLYMMPLPNIYDNSSVCLGNNKLKKAKYLEDYMENAEDLFFKTRFNALHHNSFDDKQVFIDVFRSMDLNEFIPQPAETKTIKQLLHDLS